MAAKVKALQQWCKMQCDGYRDVNVVNMTSSWKSGLAFCAIIHRYRPDLIDYDSLSKENVFENNKLAFEVAQQIGIPALLDAEDMVVMTVPDKLCIITYVSQYYNFFRSYKPASATMKRHLSEDISSTATAAKKATVEKPVLEENSSGNNVSASSKRRTLEDTCNICQRKVFLMERQIEDKKLYHRHCLRNMQKEQSSTLRSAQKLDDQQQQQQQQRGLDECREMQNESMEYDEHRSDAASGGGRDHGVAIQLPVSSVDPAISSANDKATAAEVSAAGATHDSSQVTSTASMNRGAAVTSVNKSDVVVTSAVVAPSSFSSSAKFQPKAAGGAAISSPVVTSVGSSNVSHAEERRNMSEKSSSNPAKAVDSAEETKQLTLTPASHNLQTSVDQSTPISSNETTQHLPLTSSPSILPSKASKGSESLSTQSVQAPLRPKQPPSIIPQQSGTSVNVSPSALVPPKPPRCSIIVETIAVEPEKGANDSLTETSTPNSSQSLSSHKVVSGVSDTHQKPDRDISAGGVGDARSSVQTATTIHHSQRTSASSALSPKTRPAPNPPDQAVSISTNLPVSTSTNIPVSTPVTTSVPVTTLRSILTTSKSRPAPCPPSLSLPSSTEPSPLSLKNNTSAPSALASPSPSVSTSQSILSSTSTTQGTPTTASSSSTPKPAVRSHISTPAIHPVSTPAIHPVSTPAIHPVSTPAIHPVSTPAIHPVSTPAIHPVSTPTGHAVSYPSPTSTNVLDANSHKKPETVTSHSSTSHVTSTQSIKSPISYPGRTPPSRPGIPPSGLPGQTPGASKPSPVQSSSSSADAISVSSSILHPAVTQPPDKSVALSSASPAVPSVYVVPPTIKESSEGVTVIPTKEANEQIISKETSQNGGQDSGQSVGQSISESAGQSVDQSAGQPGGKHPPIPKRPPSILVSRETEENKHLPVKLEKSLEEKSILKSDDNGETKENTNPFGSEAELVNGETVDPRPEARRSVRTNPFNSPEKPSSAVHPDNLHGKSIKDTNKDAEKVIVKPSPSPRSIGKVKADAPAPPVSTQNENNSSIWYVDLEPEVLQHEGSSSVSESHTITETKLVQEHGVVEERVNAEKTISLPVPLPRSRSKKGNDEALLPVNGDAQPRPKRLSPAPPTVQPSNSVKPPLTPADGTTGSAVMRSPPPRPTPPRAESIQQARKKITPDTTFTFEDQSFNFSPTSGGRKPSDGRELHLRSSSVASNNNQPVVKRKVNAEGRLSAQYITEQLRLLDTTLKKLEKEGRILEDRIRSGTDESMDDDDKNDLMGQWFEMINHKNDLVRQESELIYRCRQQELEGKHEEVEFELRCLMNKPDHLKTANEKKREEVLLQKLLQTVTQRNNIVESMEEDRLRYLKEDEEIAQMLTTSRLK